METVYIIIHYTLFITSLLYYLDVYTNDSKIINKINRREENAESK